MFCQKAAFKRKKAQLNSLEARILSLSAAAHTAKLATIPHNNGIFYNNISPCASQVKNANFFKIFFDKKAREPAGQKRVSNY